MYFFETTNYQTVIFEDLDRLGNYKIFVDLRELNYLINNDNSVKNKPVRFIYAVKEDVFSADDRPKFFDFIIPVVPVINATNSGEVLLHKLNSIKINGVEHDISQEFIFDIAPFISDMRTLQSTFDDFLIYKNMLRYAQRLNLIDQDMFAMMLFKNSCPNEFMEIQRERGILKKVFLSKQILIKEKARKLNDRIEEYYARTEKLTSETCSSISELKQVMLYRLVGAPHLLVQLDDYGNSCCVKYDELMNEEYDMEELVEKNIKRILYRDTRYALESKQIEKQEFVPYIERWKYIKDSEKLGLMIIRREIEDLNLKRNNVAKESLASLLSSSVINRKVIPELQNNELLLFLLRRGYINERYANYINYFKGESLTPEDMNFILSVKTQKSLDKYYRLDKIENIVVRLQTFEFEGEAVRNYDLLKYLVLTGVFSERESKDIGRDDFAIIDDRLKVLLNNLSQWAENSIEGWRFIDDFIENEKDNQLVCSRLICLLAREWQRMSYYIIGAENSRLALSREKINYYMREILLGCSIGIISWQNIKLNNDKRGVIESYLIEDRSILKILEIHEVTEMNHLLSIFNFLGIKFRDIDTSGINDALITCILFGRNYELSDTMLHTVVAYLNYSMVESLEHSPYSTILALEYAPLIDYVWGEIETFVTNFVLTRSELADEPEDVVDLLKRLNGNTDLQVQLIKHEEFGLMQIDDCAGEEVRANPETWQPVWDALLERDVITVSWENTLSYWEVYHFSKQLKKYVTEHAEILARSDFSAENEAFIKGFINAGFEISALNALLPVLRLKEFDLSISSLDERVLQAMIACRYFAFTADTFEEVSKVDQVSDASNFALEFVLKNQAEFMQIMEDVRITQNLFEQLILNERFQKKYKDELFTEYAERYMTSKLATKMKVLELPVVKAIFESAWSAVSTNAECEELLLDYYELLDADELEGHFAKIGGVYEGLTERNRVHDVRIPKTDKTYALAEYLKKIGYITSYKEDSQKVGTETHHELKLRVKKID